MISREFISRRFGPLSSCRSLRHPLQPNEIGGFRIRSGRAVCEIVSESSSDDGRGDLGRAAVTGTVDAHVEYPWKINERMALKFAFDVFNIANSKRQTLVNQGVDSGFGVPNPDFQKPFTTTNAAPANLAGSFFVAPFSSRLSVRFVF